MNLKRLLKQTLLVAMMLTGGGTFAWAETTAFSQDFTAIIPDGATEVSTNPADYGFTVTYGSGSSSSLVNFSVADGVLKCVAGPYASSSAGNRTGTATATFSAIGVGNEVTLTYKWDLGSATGNASGSYTKTRIGNGSGNALEIAFFGSDGGKLTINGNTIFTNTNIRSTTYTVTATFNMNAQKITALTLTNSKSSSLNYTASEYLDFASTISTIDRFAFENSERQSWSNTSSIDNVNITYVEAKELVNSIVVNYTIGGETLYTDNLDVTGLFCGDAYTVPFRKYIEKNGELFQVANNSSNPYYGESVTLIANNVVTKTLSKVDINNGIIAFFNDFDGSTGNNAGIRASYCGAYDNKGFTSDEDLPAGIYTFIVRAYSRGRGSSVKVGDTQVFTIADVGGSWGDKTFKDVIVPAGGKLSFVAGGSNTIDPIDIIIAIRQTVPVPVANTYATYANHSYALDFTGIDGLTAFTATLNNERDAVVFTPATQVPAGTGLLLMGETKNVPVIATADAIEDNLMFAPTTAITSNSLEFDDGTYQNYILTKPEGKSVGFYRANKNNVAVGKAYLRIPKATEARQFTFIGFDGNSETTGISEKGMVNSDIFATVPAYNLQGQRVNTPAKGLYIVNGKKVVINK